MSYQFYMSVHGSKQGTIKGSGSNPKRKDWLDVLAVYCGIPLPWTVDSRHGHKHQPIRITREQDGSSPSLFQACEASESLDAIIIQIWENMLSSWQSSCDITLTGARILKYERNLGRLAAGGKIIHDFTIDFTHVKVEPAWPSTALPWVKEWQGFTTP